MRFATGLSRNASERQGEQGEIWTEHKFMFIWLHLTFRCEDIWKWAKWFCVKACTGWFFFRCIIMEQSFASYYGMNINDQKFCTMHPSSWCCVAVFDSLFQRVFLCVSACWKEEARSWLSSCMICCEWPLLANWGQHESQCSSCVNTLSYLLLSPSHTHTLHTHSYPPPPPNTPLLGAEHGLEGEKQWWSLWASLISSSISPCHLPSRAEPSPKQM